MKRPAALVCLVLALTGQPLRQAEAASDFARMLTHLLAPGGAIEVPDGGVGDDSGVATLKAGLVHAAPDWSPAGDPCGAMGDLVHSFALALGTPDHGSPQRRKGDATWLPLGTRQRHAWLQSFRF